LKILCVTSSYPKFEGDTTAPFIASITRSLAERGHELTVVLPARPDLSPAPIDGVRFLTYAASLGWGVGRFGYAESLRGDVAVRPSTYLVAPWAVACGVARLLGAAGRERFDAVHAHWVVPSGAMAVPVCLHRRLPLVVSLHGSDVFLAERKALFRRAAGWAFARAERVTACSEDLARRSLPLGARHPVETIPYGVDVERFRPGADAGRDLRREWGMAPDEPLVLAVGRLVHKKGFDVLIDATPRLRASWPRLKVVIAGRGDLREELEHRARAVGVAEALRFAGDLEPSRLSLYYAAATVVAVPSVRDAAGNVDGLPNVLLEAMASGAAIVASSVGGIPQAIEHGKQGLLVREKEPEALAAAIQDLLGSKEERARLGSAARDRACAEFSWARAGERFEAALRSVAETGRAAS
jgi:glycosyltransferase involved in cell wall biosynthesis